MATPVLVVPTTSNIQTGVIAQPTVINALAIRDTAAHDCTTDTPGTNTFLADVRSIPGSRLLYVVNGLDQAVTITLEGSGNGTTVLAQGSGVSVAMATTQWIDASDISQLSNPYPYVSVQAQCGSSPSSGTLTVVLVASSIGGDVSNVGSISLGTTTITGALPAGTNTIGSIANTSSDHTYLASAAQTTTQTQADQTTSNLVRGIKVVLDVTVNTIGSVTLEIDGKDAASGKYFALVTGVAVVSTGTSIYTVYPGITAVTNAAVSDVLPHTWRIKLTANNANSVTYSVGYTLLV